jgi:voltage-dependent calcium channel T type alpha-1I
MPAEFFHPAVSASQKGQEKGMGAGNLPKIALQGSWASLRSPSVNCTLLRQVWVPPGLCREVLMGH